MNKLLSFIMIVTIFMPSLSMAETIDCEIGTKYTNCPPMNSSSYRCEENISDFEQIPTMYLLKASVNIKDAQNVSITSNGKTIRPNFNEKMYSYYDIRGKDYFSFFIPSNDNISIEVDLATGRAVSVKTSTGLNVPLKYSLGKCKFNKNEIKQIFN